MKTFFIAMISLLVLLVLLIHARGQFSNTVPGSISGGVTFSNTAPQINAGVMQVDVYGDSYSVMLQTLGWKSWCATNNSFASAQTNQPDGTVLFATGTYPATNVSYVQVFTNTIQAQLGVSMILNTGGAVPGQTMWNIFGGMASSNTTFVDQSYGGSYSASGVSSGLIQGNWNVTWWPKTTNDVSLTFTNGGGAVTTTTIMNTNNQPVTFPVTIGAGAYHTLILTGTPNAAVGSVITLPRFAGDQNAFAYPWHNNGTYNNGTNNIGAWVQLFTNAPNRTGVARAILLMAGGNDCAAGNVGNTNTVASAASQIPYIYTNEVNMCLLAKSLGYAVIMGVYPNAPSQSGNSLAEINALRAMQLATSPSVADVIFDLGNITTTIGDGTHPSAGQAGIIATNMVIKVFNTKLLPQRAFLKFAPSKIGN